MKKMGLNELREAYLSFFESKSHTRLDSAPLVPQGDNSLLLINSGMAPLKKYFLGTVTPPNVRVTTCQKCIRTPDIESVGKTARHGTYFEMLGNFSFGDYFKEQAIEFAWEFLTGKLEIPAEKLWVTIYEDDDQAGDIWAEKIGFPRERIVKCGKKDNFWEHGSGPCGPCSEIHFDRGEKYGPLENFEQASDCDRIIEIWNLVFTQFDSDGNGNYAEMASKNIDTGMGLERLACVMQGVDNLFEVDTVRNIMNHISDIAKVNYKENEKQDMSLRVVTDHIRSTVFMVGDGVMPSNVGRGYVLRRLLRRAARHGRLLGIDKPFLFEVCNTVIEENKSAYPELAEKADYIKKIVLVEEENFAKTVDKGMELLNGILSEILKNDGEKMLSGDDAFKLNDTFGFPLDLTIEIAEEKGISVDVERFKECLQIQKDTARKDRLSKTGSSWDEDTFAGLTAEKTVFTGYEKMDESAKILAIYKDSSAVEKLAEGEDGIIILDKTCFYAESGGQVGDVGFIKIGESEFVVTDTKKASGGQFLHIGYMNSGEIAKNDEVSMAVDSEKRLATMRNHSSAHLLQSALKTVLGDHVHQAGSYVDTQRCRFDFSHFSALTAEEIAKVEQIVNKFILQALFINMNEMPIDEAKNLGATALFGEKYGDFVRVVTMGDASVEFCGGTHLDNTSKIGLFKIVSESSIAAGVRRIEAVTGEGVLAYIEENNKLISDCASVFKTANLAELPQKCAATLGEIKALEKELDDVNKVIADEKLKSVLENAVELNGVQVSSATFELTKSETLKMMCEKCCDKNPLSIAVLAGFDKDQKGVFAVGCGKEAIAKGAHSGKIAQKISALTGGKGGGRPDTAMAGIGDKSKVNEALAQLSAIISEFIK